MFRQRLKFMKIGYIRSNSRDDFYEKQLNALHQMECGRIFEDFGSNVNELTHMMDYLRDDDAVCIYQLDRLGLDVKHLMKFTYDLMERNICLMSVRDGIDTASPEGELLFKIFNALTLCEQNALPTHYGDPKSRQMPGSGLKAPDTSINSGGMNQKEDHSMYASNVHTMQTNKAPPPVQKARQIAAACAAGGRPRGLTADAKQKAEAAASLYQEGALSMREIASNLNISTATLYSYLRHEKVI